MRETVRVGNGRDLMRITKIRDENTEMGPKKIVGTLATNSRIVGTIRLNGKGHLFPYILIPFATRPTNGICSKIYPPPEGPSAMPQIRLPCHSRHVACYVTLGIVAVLSQVGVVYQPTGCKTVFACDLLRLSIGRGCLCTD
jgi:hypothetical protein